MATSKPKTTIVRGNIVTPRGVLYGGFLEVQGETIVRVESRTGKLPLAVERILKRRAEKREEGAEKIPENSEDEERYEVVESPWVLPGFVDIHNHGVGGVTEVCEHWNVPEFSQRYLAHCGTLSVIASLIFSAAHPENVTNIIKTLEGKHIGRYSTPNGSVVEGIHAEGPIIADQGGLPACDDNMPFEKFKQLCDSMPSMKVMTIAPSKESSTNFARIRYLVERNVRVSLGHDKKATEEDILGAMRVAADVAAQRSGLKSTGPGSQAGSITAQAVAQANNPDTEETSIVPPTHAHHIAKTRMHCTHMFNVMQAHHRNPSLVNFLMCRRLPAAPKYEGCTIPTVEIISDLIHVHPVVIQSLLTARDLKDIAIISDCISSYEPGKRLKYNGRDITVRAEGGCYLCDKFGRPTQTLAGSTSTLADQFLILISQFHLDIATACRLLATNPARFAHIDDRVGSLAPGTKANLLLFNTELNTIERRMIYGNFTEDTPHRILKPSIAHL